MHKGGQEHAAQIIAEPNHQILMQKVSIII